MPHCMTKFRNYNFDKDQNPNFTQIIQHIASQFLIYNADQMFSTRIHEIYFEQSKKNWLTKSEESKFQSVKLAYIQ